MQLIQHQEFQPLGIADHLLIERILPGKDVLQHHVVREQDVGRIVLDLLPFLIALLTRVTRKGDPWAVGIAKAQILLQLLQLAVAQRIHRVDHNRPNALLLIARLTSFQHPIDDRNDVAQRLAGTCA